MKKWFPPAPTLRQIPLMFARAALFGVMTGPFIGLLIAWLTNAPWDRISAHPARSLLATCAVSAIFAVSFYAACGLPLGYLRRLLKDSPPAIARIVTALAGLGGGALGLLLAIGSIKMLFNAQIETPISLGKLALVDGIIAMVIALAIASHQRAQAVRDLIAARAQSQALQAQINPHFFFNTLNTISAMIPTHPREAQKTIGELADMFRYTLACAQQERVPIEGEIEFARNYLSIEQARFGDRLQFELPAPGAAIGLFLPGLTLQPLVENAVRHGIVKRIDGGSVVVGFVRNAAELKLSVSNPADGDVSFPPGHALSIVRDRLTLLHGSRASVTATRDRGIVTVTVRVPIS